MSGFVRLSAVLERADVDEGRLYFLCPGCQMVHGISVGEGPGPRWTWNGSADRPSFQPSILVRYPWRLLESGEREQVVCHSFVTDGRIQFLSDCTHELAGQTVDLPNLDDEA
ncbi:DUF6527 family protein [Pseudomonas citronellolis]|uniref:DUF6527 family protein n=1 Tax=Pseudomonas citronellolis TaxID=53408 RepID=UPI00248E293F|nr:DUF6527 family protein [Pseudomonas citronellolis]